MNKRVLFMIIGDEVKYLADSNMDHREWYISLGYDGSDFENIIRGYVIDGKIVFFKGENFNYDESVMRTAKRFSQGMRLTLNNPNLEVWCGIVINSYGEKWEPIVKIDDSELVNSTEEKKVEVKKEIKTNNSSEPRQLVEFKNNYEDPKFIKIAIIVSVIMIVLDILVKIYLGSKETFHMSNLVDFLLTIGSVGLLGYAVYGYKKKLSITKYVGVAASICLLLMLDFFDIILGIGYFVFSIDQGYFAKAIKMIKNKGRGNENV